MRDSMLPYGRQLVDEDDVAAVVRVLRSDWLTTGPLVGKFEEAFAAAVDAREAVAVSSGTAALHAAMFAAEIGPGDEVIVPAMTFAASANCVLYQGGTPVFADVDPGTLLIDPESVERRVTRRTKALIAVDYAGQPCDYHRLRQVAQRHGLALVADACHALGGAYHDRRVGSLADLNVFSLHPVKHITTGEGGMITAGDAEHAQRLRLFRNHGINTDHRQREQQGSWFYEMVELGYNYRITDIQCGLGLSQLEKLPHWIARRRELARFYDSAFAGIEVITPLETGPDVVHAYHLYVVRVDFSRLRADRRTLFRAFRAEGIGVNVHYLPVHCHPYYQSRLGTHMGLCPVAEAAYEQILSLPLYPGMTDADARDVVAACEKIVAAYHA